MLCKYAQNNNEKGQLRKDNPWIKTQKGASN